MRRHLDQDWLADLLCPGGGEHDDGSGGEHDVDLGGEHDDDVGGECGDVGVEEHDDGNVGCDSLI